MINLNFKWYLMNVAFGQEEKVSASIKEVLSQEGLTDHVIEIFVPIRDVLRVKNGKKTQVSQKLFPGYIFIHTALTSRISEIIRSTSKVINFIGDRSPSGIIPEHEIQQIMLNISEAVAAKTNVSIFEIGEKVKITAGPFESFIGLIDEVDDERKRIKLSVSIFGRSTPVDLEMTQVEKVVEKVA